MVNVIEPQFNLHSEDANVSSMDISAVNLTFSLKIFLIIKKKLVISCDLFSLFWLAGVTFF